MHHRPRSGLRLGPSAWGLLLALLLAGGCARAPDEAALREAVAGAQAAIENRDADTLAEYLAEDFVGNDGLDRSGARRLAALQFMRTAEVGVTLGPLDVTLQDGYATVRSSAALTGGSGRLLPDRAQAYALETGWRVDDGAWRMTSARWSPLSSGSR